MNNIDEPCTWWRLEDKELRAQVMFEDTNKDKYLKAFATWHQVASGFKAETSQRLLIFSKKYTSESEVKKIFKELRETHHITSKEVK